MQHFYDEYTREVGGFLTPYETRFETLISKGIEQVY